MPTNLQAVLYLRSSKDRHDVSIEHQRSELTRLAAERGLRLVAEYVDVVESGKDDDRPGFQALIEALGRRDRGWSTILVLDTSRLARRLAAAVKFEEEACRPRGVTVVYKSIPDQAEEAERALIKAVFHGVDEWHSLVSKRKGLAGMRQNVRSGYRAGGRAPYGYQLDHVDLGIVRDGKPVLKSRLAPSEHAPLVQHYLRERAAGATREPLARRLGLTLNPSSLVGLEWNALTYAGHTVWNVHNEQAGGRYVTGEKRRPRAEWVVQRDTHPALITDAEAEALLGRLEQASASRPRRSKADYLLTGLLRTSGGEPWRGEKHRYYRAGTRSVSRADVDAAILGKVAADLRSADFSSALVRRTRSSYGREFGAELARLREAQEALDRRISGFMDMAEKLQTPGPVLRKVDELEADRRRVGREIEQASKDAATAAAARAVTEGQVGRLLDAMATDMQRLDQQRLKDFLHSICEGITLNPETLTAGIHYKIPLGRRNRVASPRETEAITHGKTVTYVKVRRAA